MEAPARVVEGGLPERATGTELEQPARVERAASSLAPFGRLEPVMDGVTCGVALGACELAGTFDATAVTWEAAVFGGLAFGAGIVVHQVRSRDRRADRMRWSEPLNDGVETVERFPRDADLLAAAGWRVARYATLLAVVVSILYALDPEEYARWPLVLCGLILSRGVNRLADRRAVRAYEREHGVVLFRGANEDDADDTEEADEDEDELEDDDGETLPDGDPGPLYRRPAHPASPE